MKFAIVTPTFNAPQFIQETIDSILMQEGDFEIDYIIVDGGSTEENLKVIKDFDKKYKKKQLNIKCKKFKFNWISERDNGMYDAIAKGFKKVNGDIMCWLNDDDIFLEGALKAVSETFEKYPEIEWLTGNNNNINEKTEVIQKGTLHLFNQKLIAKGLYGPVLHYIHQESTFWRKELYEKAGGLNRGLKLAGDFQLWVKFAQYAKLTSLDYRVACFRVRANQKSSNYKGYLNECAMFRKYSVLEEGYYWFLHHLGSKKLSQTIHTRLLEYLSLILLSHFKGYSLVKYDNIPVLSKTYFI
ncbi:MAG TPA: glycosyltransferase family 2 protein [Candidatus Dojkabacteria bacterium]|nr:glycosyltransferase family 2 protein [Candidatus Dojkabacteria bacterium]